MNNFRMDRREFLGGITGLAAASAISPSLLAASTPLQSKPIPKSGEQVPVIGMGTSRTFDVKSDPTGLATSTDILKMFFHMGGTVIDSSPMYRSSEAVLGHCLKNIDDPHDMFAATKVWTRGKSEGIKQMAESEELWGVNQFDLIAVHNFSDWRTQLETLKAWKEQERVRYIGVTTSHGRSHAEMKHAISREQDYDWVQFTYSIQEREAEKHLLPMALEHGKAVMVNRPFGRGGLFGKVRGKSLPDWASEIDVESWGQFFLKFTVSHPAVTCAIPATSKVKHMQDNMGACYGRLPDDKMREEMIQYMDAI